MTALQHHGTTDLTRAYAARDRAAITERLEPDPLACTGGALSMTHGRAADAF